MIVCNNFKTLKSDILKKRRIYNLEQNESKVKSLKKHYPKHIHVIKVLDGYSTDIIDDLYRVSLYDSNHYVHPASNNCIRELIYPYLDEFRNDPVILDFFDSILSKR